jgi:two-component system, NarL family, response regulator NreC
MLGARAGIQVVGEAKNGREGIWLAHALAPDLVIIDLHMPDMRGIDAIAQIRRRRAKVRILVLTTLNSEECVRASLCAGANGYVLKDDCIDEVFVAMSEVLAGKRHLSPSVIIDVVALSMCPGSAKKESPKSPLEPLTVREREILRLVAEGHTSKRIAELICLTVNTVSKYRANVMNKLNRHSAAALTQFAIENGLTAPRLRGGLSGGHSRGPGTGRGARLPIRRPARL